jgi:hypothetical protein
LDNNSSRQEDHEWFALVLVFAGVGSLVGVLIGSAMATLGHRLPDWASYHPVNPSFVPVVAAAPVREPTPALWSIFASVGGRTPIGVRDLSTPHSLSVSMHNAECLEGEQRRCCHAHITFDGSEDLELEHSLCVEFQADAVLSATDHDTPVSPRVLDAFVAGHRFARLYTDRFGGEPNDQSVHVQFEDYH